MEVPGLISALSVITSNLNSFINKKVLRKCYSQSVNGKYWVTTGLWFYQVFFLVLIYIQRENFWEVLQVVKKSYPFNLFFFK